MQLLARRRTPALRLAAVVALGLTGPAAAEELRSPKERAHPRFGAAALRSLTTQDAAFACDLYRSLAREGAEDLVLSPASVSHALALAYAGARGQTEREMAAALHFVLPQERLHRTRNALEHALTRRGREGAPGHAFRLRWFRGVWSQDGAGVRPGYLDVLAQHYGLGLRVLDGAGGPRAAREQVNAWAEERSDGASLALLDADDVRDSGLLVVDAVGCRGAWASPFPAVRTSPGAFRTLPGEEVTVPLMRRTLTAPYAEGDDYRAVELPYAGRRVSMILLVPGAGAAALEAFERSLTAERLAGIRAALDRPRPVAVTLPRFTVRSRLELERSLRALGMEAPFDPGRSDFTGIAPQADLALGGVVHRAELDVDEAGTHLAPGAASLAADDAAAPEATLRCDRPFLFLVVDRPTGAVLFLGRVLDPS